MFKLLVSHLPGWCESAGACGDLVVSPGSAAPGDSVWISGHAPLNRFEVGSHYFSGGIHLSRRAGTGFGHAVFVVKPAPTFASLGDTRPVAEFTAGAQPLAADPSDPDVVAWCAQGTIGISVDGARRTISTRAAGSVLGSERFVSEPPGPSPSCADVVPLSATTVEAGFDVSIKSHGSPPFY
ncbi:MAG TPA: hypothetical protein VME01_03885, partial [Solirubrobacteraceae bacterium]|nr:hypothetical protein [Solirubrobacteraceae bacterium]